MACVRLRNESRFWCHVSLSLFSFLLWNTLEACLSSFWIAMGLSKVLSILLDSKKTLKVHLDKNTKPLIVIIKENKGAEKCLNIYVLLFHSKRCSNYFTLQENIYYCNRKTRFSSFNIKGCEGIVNYERLSKLHNHNTDW